jgi:hypothetical protein
MIKKTKGLGLIKMIFIINLDTFGLILFLTLQIMDLKNVALTKNYSYNDKGMNCIIHMI